jgi:hypothetical protein
MTYTFKLARRLAGNHHQFMAVCTALTLLSGCVPGGEADPVLADRPGSVYLTVNGLAPQGSPQLLLTGPGGFSQTVSQAGTLTGLPLGNYVVHYLPTTVDGDRWAPTPESQAILISSAGVSVPLAVSYHLASGAMAIRTTGLPEAAQPAVRLTGPDGYDREVLGATTVRGLAPGSYTVTPLPALSGSAVYRPAQPAVQVEIAVGETPVAAELAFWRVQGTLDVHVGGLPSGAAAQFTIAGPGNFIRQFTSGTTLPALDPGAYTVTSVPVVWQGNTWATAANVIPVQVDTGTTTVELTHQIATGTLELDVEGLPAGVTAQAVRVTGPGGFLQDVSASQQWVGVSPGSYTATAAPVLSGARKFVPTQTNHVISVAPGTNPSRARVHYTESYGALTISINGLPGGVAGRVVVIGSNFADTVTATTTLTNLVPGTYSLVATNITTAGTVHQASPSSQAAVVAAGATVSKAVVYAATAPTTGSLTVTVAGLPNGGAAAIAVTGPGGFSTTFTETTTLTGLVPGAYFVAAANAVVAGTVFTPALPMQSATVTAGSTDTKTVSYTAAAQPTGRLAVTLSGLPQGIAGDVTVTGPNDFTAQVGANATLADLAIGNYTITAAPVTAAGVGYQATPATQSAAVTAGATVNKAIAYAAAAPTTGSLTITVSGLPGAAAGAVAVSGPEGFTRAVTQTTTITGLAPGTYAIGAANITASGTSYQPTPTSQTAAITAGNTVTKTVTYAAAVPTTGSLTITLTGLPGEAGGAVTVTGPESFSRAVTQTTTITNLAPGTYTIAAASISVSGTSYPPTPTSQTAAITAGNTVTKTVTYAAAVPTTGSLTITLAGLPGAAAGAVTVTGPGSFSRAVTQTTTLTDLVPGTYTIGAANITVSGTSYPPTPTSQTAAITAGNTVTKTVTYAAAVPTTGALTVTLSGLPGIAAGAVTVTGPGSFSRAVTQTTTVTGLVPGSYTITAANITSGGSSYQPTPTSQSASVTAGTTASKTVTYAVAAAGPQVTLNSGIRYQTMDMWETSLRMWEQDKINNRFDGSIETYNVAVSNYLVDSVGINGVRLQVNSGLENPQDDWTPFTNGSMTYTAWSPGRYEKFNDNSNPNSANLAGFQFAPLDYQVEKMVLPLKARLAARGEQLHINLNYLDFNWNAARQGTLNHATNSAEFAEFVLVYFQHLRDKYGIVPDAFEMILEPENTQSWTGANIGRGLVAVAARLAAGGFHPEFIAPSTTNMSHAVTYFNDALAIAGAGNLISTLAYHRYGGESPANAQAIRNAAAARGIKTAMLEKVGAGIDELMEDLTVANVSAWQQWGMADRSEHTDAGGYYVRVNVGQSPTSAISMASRTKLLAHVFRSVRRGAVRIGSSSTAANHVTAAFINPDGRWSAIVRAETSGGQVTLNGLPAGRYEVRFTSDAGVSTAAQTVTVSAAYTTTLPASGVLSVRGVP